MVPPVTEGLTQGSRPKWSNVCQTIDPKSRFSKNAFGDSGYQSNGENQYEHECRR